MICACGGYLVLTAENLTCIDCSRTQECLTESNAQDVCPRRNMGESTSTADCHPNVGSLANILEREGLEAFKAEIIDVLTVIMNIKAGDNICMLSAIFFVVNKYRYLPLSSIIKYSESAETLSTLNSKISKVFFKGNLSFPLPNAKYMISFALSHMQIKVHLIDSICEKHEIIESLLLNNRIYTKKELSIILVLNEIFNFERESVKYLCSIFGINLNAYRRLYNKYKLIK